MEFSLGPMAHDERAMVANSWVKSHASSTLARVVSTQGTLGRLDACWRPSDEYWLTWNGLVNALIQEADVLVLRDDAGLVAAFMVSEPWDNGTALHYLYTRLMYRGRGLAKRLVSQMRAGPVYFTHRSRGIGNLPAGWVYTLRPLLRLLREEALRAA